MMESIFPDPDTAEGDILCVSRDLNVPMLVDAYLHGIFPWPYDNASVPWASPEKRAVFRLESIHVPKRLPRALVKHHYSQRIDTCFDSVILNCATQKRPDQGGTWITPKLIRAFKEFHRAGYAHSFEVFSPENVLCGGLYGVSLGKIFCGESMFHSADDASKYALLSAMATLRNAGVEILDSQVPTPTTTLFGVEEIPRKEYLRLLNRLAGKPLSAEQLRQAASGPEVLY